MEPLLACLLTSEILSLPMISPLRVFFFGTPPQGTISPKLRVGWSPSQVDLQESPPSSDGNLKAL